MNPFIAAFKEAVASQGGEIVKDVSIDNDRQLVCGLWQICSDIDPRDRLSGGMALVLAGQEAQLCPYVVRHVCTNGAAFITADNSQTFGAEDIEPFRAALSAVPDQLAQQLSHVAMRFRRGQQVKLSPAQIDHVVRKLGAILHPSSQAAPFFRRQSARERLAVYRQRLLDEMQREASRWPDSRSDNSPSLFDLVNAVTAIARDTDDPGQQWALECLGGTLLIQPPAGMAASTAPATVRQELSLV
ncbi:MAG: hypothetical protein OHK0039_05710 [Bacteroidia bacterium]